MKVLNSPSVEQCGDLFQLRAMGFDDEESALGAGIALSFRSDGHQSIAVEEQRPGAAESFSANGIEHDIDGTYDVFEAGGIGSR